MGIRRGLGVFKQAGKQFAQDRCPILGAAMAYYTSLAMAPMLIILLSMAALAGQDTQQGVVDRITAEVGPRAGAVVENIIQAASQQGRAGLSAGLGILVTLISATLLFAQLQTALNIIWGVRMKKGRGVRNFLRKRLTSLAMILGVGVLMVAGAIAASIVTTAIGGNWVAQIANHLVSLGLFTVLFALVFRYLPDVNVQWKHVWLGAIITAVLFAIGRAGLSVYLSTASVGSAYGAAGSLVVILVWVFYAAQIVFFGAELTQVVADRYGAGIVPADYAEWINPPVRKAA